MSTPTVPTSVLPTPREMIAQLDRYVIGQDRAKRDLAVAVYNHYLALAYASTPGARHTDFGSQHLLLIGPTGSGKTHMVRCLARMLDVPISFASATSLAEVGYKGDSVDTLIRNLVSAARGNMAKAHRGIIYIDEVDKIRRVRESAHRDVSGEGVQNALLTLLDGCRTTFADTSSAPKITMDVSKILFICTGAFSDLPEIVRRRVSRTRPFGFGNVHRTTSSAALAHDDDAYANASPEDLVEFGFIPEIVGRFTTITALNSLSTAMLKRILTNGEDSVLAKQKTRFALHGIDLVLPDKTLTAIAQTSTELKLGARGLARLLRKALHDVDYRLPDLRADGVVRIIIPPQTVLHGDEPVLVYREEIRPQFEPQPPLHNHCDPPAGHDPPLPSLDILRRSALPSPNATIQAQSLAQPAACISMTIGWSDEEITDRLEDVKQQLDWENTSGSARKWWDAFEQENRKHTPLVLRLAEELLARNATIGEFFLAYIYSNTDNIQANLHYLDYKRLKLQEEERKRAKASQESEASANDDSTTTDETRDEAPEDPIF